MRPENKGTGPPPDSRLHPPVALSHRGCREINENVAKRQRKKNKKNEASAVLCGSPCAGCRSPVSHGCIYNFMRVRFQIDSSLMPGSGFIIAWPFK